MKSITGRISEVDELYGELGIKVSFPQLVQAIPGQYLLARSSESNDVLPTVLYPYELNENIHHFAGLIPNTWLPGVSLAIHGPIGNGFQLPPQSGKVALVAVPGASIIPLLTLAKTALINNAEIVLLTASSPAFLPAEIEVLPVQMLPEIQKWADYIAAVAELSSLGDLINFFIPTSRQHLHPHVEVMIQTKAICAGTAACGVCSVFTKKGWKLACKEGPVFILDELDVEP
jgi:dihydroorotate dehydrogenase electron transfer subunit